MNEPGAVSAYDNGGRVKKVSEHALAVSTHDGLYHVTAWDGPDEWWIDQSGAGVSFQTADRRGREDASSAYRDAVAWFRSEAEAWANTAARGPFRTADEAIRELIGEPR